MDKKSFVDVLNIVFFAVIIYFFVLGGLTFFNSRISCDFTQTSNYGYVYNWTQRIDLISVRAFVNTSGLFDNGLLFTSEQSISNCSFSLTK